MMPDNKFKLVLSNTKSIYKRLPELRQYIIKEDPDIFCFNETWLENITPKFYGYDSIWKHRNRHGGGVGIIVKDNIHFQQVNMQPYNNAAAEVICIKVKLKNRKNLNILCIYNSEGKMEKREFIHYIRQVENNFIIMGDLNARTQVLDTRITRTNVTGRALEEVLISEDICLVNKQNFYTFINEASGQASCLDLCLVSPALFLNTSLDRGDDIGSDHSPIVAEINLLPEISAILSPSRYKVNNLENDKWEKWTKAIPTGEENYNNIEHMNKNITQRLIAASEITLNKSNGKIRKKKSTPWWSIDCSRAVAARRYARRKLEKHSTAMNLKNYNQKKNAADLLIQNLK